MSETESKQVEPEEGSSEEAAPQEQASSSRQGDWGGPTEDEWRTTVGALQHLYERSVQSEQAEEAEEPDYSDMDYGQLVKHYVDQRMGQVEPVIAEAAKEAGERRLNQLLDQFEADPQIGKLSPQSRKVAEYAAQGMLPQVGDPVEAVRQGALYAAQLTRSEREAAITEYKASLSRTPYDDPAVGGGAQRIAPGAKTYDEVINKWSGDEEV